MKIFFFLLCSGVVAAISGYFNILIDDGLLSTIYNTIGIVFSIGMGLIVTFSITGVENKDYILAIRRNINYVRNRFIILFSFCTVLFVLNDNMPKILCDMNIIKFLPAFTLSFFCFSIIYFITNFIRLQKLNDDIFDRLLQEKNKHKL